MAAAKTRGCPGLYGYNHHYKFLWRPKPGVTITPEEADVSLLWYILRKIDKSNSPTRAGRSCLLLLWCRDRCMSRGALRESSQCGGCGTRWNPGTLGNGGATLPRWMSSQFGVRRALQHWNPKDGTQFGCAPSRVCVGPLSARCRVEDPSLHVWPPNTCHTPVAVTPRPQRKPSCRRTELLAIKLNFCRLGSKCWRTVRRRELRK